MTNNRKLIPLNIQKFSDEIEVGKTIQINGSATLTDVDASKNSKVLRLLGQTSQDGTPTPSSPIPVNVVSGDNTINICGKNLLDIEDTTFTNNGLTYKMENGVIRITGTAGSAGNSTYNFSSKVNFDEINKIPNGTLLTFSVLDIVGLSASQIFIGKKGSPYWLQPNATTKKATVTKDADLTSITIWFSTTTGTTYDITIRPQLEVGSTATTYEPYIGHSYPISLGSIELCKIGTYQDYIYKDNGSWYLHKEIGKVVLNGSENWVKHGSIASWFYYDGITNGYVLDNTQVLIKTNYYTPKAYQGVPNLVNGECSYGSSDGGITHRFVIKNTDYTQTQDFKTWLSTHNTMLYYVLATPTTEEITDTTLIEQLEALQST